MEDVAPPQKKTFPGFPYPMPKGDLRFPHPWFDEIISQIHNLAEMKIVMYVYRHTCGFHKPFQGVILSTDEFMNGRMKADHTLMDRGTGLSEKSVRNGIKDAKSHGYLVVEVDERDKARIRKSYRLKFDISAEGQSLHLESESEGQSLPPEGQSLHLGRETLPPRGVRSPDRTDKDKEKITQKDNEKDTAQSHQTIPYFIKKIIREQSCLKGEREYVDENITDIVQIYEVSGLDRMAFERLLNQTVIDAAGKGMDYFFQHLCSLAGVRQEAQA